MIRSARVAPMMNQQQEEMKPLRNIVRNMVNTVRTTNTQQGEQHLHIQEESGGVHEGKIRVLLEGRAVHLFHLDTVPMFF